MMEVPASDQFKQVEVSESIMDPRLPGSNCQDATTNLGRKVISRASRGGFQGQMGGSSITRIGKGEYSSMIKAMNYDHHDNKMSAKKMPKKFDLYYYKRKV